MRKDTLLPQSKDCVLLLVGIFCWANSVLGTEHPDWQRKEVDLRLSGGSRIKAVNYPGTRPVTLLTEMDSRRPNHPYKKVLAPKTVSETATEQQFPAPSFAAVIDSPPIDGFLPWIVVAVTDERSGEFELDAVPEASVVGNYLTANPKSDYTIGIFDTGASTHILSAEGADRTGLVDSGLVTSSTVELLGVIGSVFAFVSQPIGIFIDGLRAIEPDGLLTDDSNMVGETNVSVLVGDPIESPNVPTVIGTPMSVFFAAAFYNNQPITVTIDDNEYTAPDIHFYDLLDPQVPQYTNKIYLELRPDDVGFVQYFPCIEPLFECPDGDGSPLYPTMIVDGWWQYQGLFFVSSVDITEGEEIALDKDGFIFDTGAQVSVISEFIAARLRLNPNDPDFTVEIQDVTGQSITAPGFYVDLLEIVATPEWLSFTDVPVIMLDIASPEGGYLDGIIGMNLFVELNFVFHGGGLSLYGQDAPFIEFEHICRIIGDIAPEGGDCKVDYLDLAALADHWLETPASPNWNPDFDLAPEQSPDGRIDLLDFAVLAEHWLE